MALAAFGSGCLGSDEQAPAARGAPRAIAQVIDRLERASVRGDWASVCDELFTEAARERAGGGDCARVTREAAAGIERPRIAITAISVRGASARVTVRTRAEGQAAVADVLAAATRGRRVAGGGARVTAQARQPASASSVTSKSVFAIAPRQGELAPASP